MTSRHSAVAAAAVGIVRQDLGDLATWARGHGFQPGTVWATLRRWAWRIDEMPHGGISRSVMAAVRRDLTPGTLSRMLADSARIRKVSGRRDAA